MRNGSWVSDCGSDRNSFRRMSRETRFLSSDKPGISDRQLWDRSSSTIDDNDGGFDINGRENASRDMSVSDTTLSAPRGSIFEIPSCVILCSPLFNSVVLEDDDTVPDESIILVCIQVLLSVLFLLFFAIFASILTSGRLSNRILFSNFCLSLCAIFKALAFLLNFLRASRSDEVKGVCRMGVSIAASVRRLEVLCVLSCFVPDLRSQIGWFVRSLRDDTLQREVSTSSTWDGGSVVA